MAVTMVERSRTSHEAKGSCRHRADDFDSSTTDEELQMTDKGSVREWCAGNGASPAANDRNR